MDQPLVSICIPTYNRADYLSRSLKSLVMQKLFQSGHVEVVISDNASMDNTEEISREFSRQYHNVRYFRNSNNILDANFPLVLSYGNGKLLKICNDTLEYNEDALELLCNNVEKYKETKPMLFFGNGNKSIKIPKSKEDVLNLEELLRSVSYWTTWISSFSCWKTDFEKIGVDEESCSTRLWQVKQICRIMEVKNKAVIIPDVFCEIQTVKNKDISYGLYEVFYINYLSILKTFSDRGVFSQTCYDYLKKDLLLNFFPQWIVNWQLQEKSLNYSKEEDLKKKVIDTCKGEPYLNEYKKIYLKVLLRTLILKAMKNIKMFVKRRVQKEKCIIK
jgi:abequosyltransferase